MSNDLIQPQWPMQDMATWKKHKGLVCDQKDDKCIIDCHACGFKHVIPLPSFDDLKHEYSQNYYHIEKPLYIQRHQEDMAWWEIVYNERYDFFERILDVKDRRILDIGSGPGHFLLRGRERGWDTLGIEPSKQASDYSIGLGLNIINDFFTAEVADKLGIFNAIHLSEVLEHIPDPIDFLNRIYQMLDPSGLICISVPNDYNPIQFALSEFDDKKRWWVVPSHHLNYFSFSSLRSLLQRTGFQVLHEETSFPIELFLLMGDNYIDNDELGRLCHAKRKRFEMTMEKAGLGTIKREIYMSLAKKNIGRHIIMFARKR